MKRRLSLILCALFLHSSWGPELKWLCNPVLSCHSCVLAWFACPIGVFVHYSGYHLFPFWAFGTVLLIGVLAGRLLCGWVCPFGLVQDLLYQIPTPKFPLPDWTASLKYGVLGLLVVFFPFLFGEQTWLSFCRICPAAALQVSLPEWVRQGWGALGVGGLLRFGVLGAILFLAMSNSRSFCRTLCPMGALMAPLNWISYWRVKPLRPTCLECRKCDQACRLNLRPSVRFARQVPANRTWDCMVCHECQSACKGLPQAMSPSDRPGSARSLSLPL